MKFFGYTYFTIYNMTKYLKIHCPKLFIVKNIILCKMNIFIPLRMRQFK